ncbi:hypothetical protein [Rhizobium straminoryzae]|uniref:Uncharacterized protein n=1 Tax=Rhizobium straminoryzae TaxID=1387186 RepID=A0A549TAA9_9HYPH|nr:hypothetical protein [Rhizobium straminoryzae]TRL38811.1 hypothetical protein FNA46_11655 [Rhizobium straminoryzae]
MNSAYNVADITVAQVDRAFPLASAADVAADLGDWRQFCERIIAARDEGGAREHLLVCENGLGYLKGLCLATLRDTDEGAVMDVPLHVVATVLDEDGVRSALRERLQGLAASAGGARLQLPA